MRCDDADLVHGLDTDSPIRSKVPTVVTVHDLGLFDVPWAFPTHERLVKSRFVATAIRHADVLIAVSTFTAERVAARFGRQSTVIHEAAGSGFHVPTPQRIASVRDQYQLPERFVLYLGNREPRKDVAALAAACRAVAIPLIVAGGAITSVALPDEVRVIGYVPDADLAPLYAAADVVGYVARYEGFGLPPVEAMASGACVMATRVGALSDIATEGIEFVATGSAEAQASALRELLGDASRAEHRRRCAVVEATALSWERAARETVAVYQTLL